MGIFDKAKDLAAEHSEAIHGGIDKAAGLADQRTGGKYGEHLDKGAETAKSKLGDYLNPTEPTDNPTPPPA